MNMMNEGDRLSINKNEYLPGVCMLKLDDIYRDYNNTVIVAYRLMIYYFISSNVISMKNLNE